MIDRATDILGLVDVQPTFMPGGELAVTDGEAVVPVINRLLACLPRLRHPGLAPARAQLIRQRTSRP